MSDYLNNFPERSDKYFIARSESKGSWKEQLSSCLDQIKPQITEGATLLKLTIFINATDNKTFYQYQSDIPDYCKQSGFQNVPLSLIPQPPADGCLLCLEAWIATGKVSAEYKQFGSIPYIICDTDNYTELIVSNLQHKLQTTDIYEQSTEAFKQMITILEKENMKLSDVIRQWNYIENITGYDGNSQHYQIFNDIRSEFYSRDTFSNGYPAATGIGSSAGGVIIDFIAVKPKSDCEIRTIKSPVQKDAHLYSKEVLAAGGVDGHNTETSPKFERGKALLVSDYAQIYISGTAAIIGQKSQSPGDAAGQTKTTIENIKLLVESVQAWSAAKPALFRVYIKNAADIESVTLCFKSLLPPDKTIFVIADICRPELLVEIEGVYIADK